jgi:hypothetical protein
MWWTFRLSSTVEELGVIGTPLAVIESLLAGISLQPLAFLSQKTEALHQSLFNLANVSISLFSQIFGTFSVFDWSLLSGELGDGDSNYIIFQHLHLFWSTLQLFCLMCPHYFSDNIRFESLVVAVLSESPDVRLTDNIAVELKSLMALGTATYQKHVITSLFRGVDTKLQSAHRIRITCLRNLLEEYIDRATENPDILCLHIDQILAVLSFAYFELMVCLDSMGGGYLFSTVLRTFELIERHQTAIQRTFLFTIWSIDLHYLDQITQIFRDIGQATHHELMGLIETLTGSLRILDLERFDEGVRYDFFPFFVTHGRIVAHSYMHRGSDQSYLAPILEHLVTIARHAALVQSPAATVLDLVPMSSLCRIIPAIPDLLRRDQIDLALIPWLFTFFRCIPQSPTNAESLRPIPDAILDFLLERMGDTVPEKGSDDVQFGFPSPDANKRAVNVIPKICQALSALPDDLKFADHVYDIFPRFRERFLAMFTTRVLNAKCHPDSVRSAVMAMLAAWRPVFEICELEPVRFLLANLAKAAALGGDGSFYALSRALSGNERCQPPCGFLENLLSVFEWFIAGGHKKSLYDQPARRFVSLHGSRIIAEQFFAVGPLCTLVRLFGVRGSVRVNLLLMRSAVESLGKLIGIYENQKANISNWFGAFVIDQSLQKCPLNADHFRNAADALLTFGLVLTIRALLQRASETVLDSMLPGFLALVECAIDSNKMTLEALGFVEAIRPGADNSFLRQRIRGVGQPAVDARRFFFFLGLLLGNPKWDDLTFDMENDVFKHNLQLLPVAIEKIIGLADDLFKGADAAMIDDALAIFFAAVGAVAEVKKEKSRAMFLPFVILIDHFPAIAKEIDYAHMKHAFPATVIRACYSELADSVKRTPGK